MGLTVDPSPNVHATNTEKATIIPALSANEVQGALPWLIIAALVGGFCKLEFVGVGPVDFIVEPGPVPVGGGLAPPDDGFPDIMSIAVTTEVEFWEF